MTQENQRGICILLLLQTKIGASVVAPASQYVFELFVARVR